MTAQLQINVSGVIKGATLARKESELRTEGARIQALKEAMTAIVAVSAVVEVDNDPRHEV